jgi:hypothetical protein
MHGPLNVKSEILLQNFRSESRTFKVGFWVTKMALVLTFQFLNFSYPVPKYVSL